MTKPQRGCGAGAARQLRNGRNSTMTINQRRSLDLLAGLLMTVCVGLLTAPAVAQPASWTQVGMLSCRLNPSIGFIIAGHQTMECRFTQNQFPPQAYEGALNTVGLDIGISAGGVLGWAVLAPTDGAPAGALAGEYVGASGDIGIGIGVG